MARIGGVDTPKNKKGRIALTYVYGIGYTTALSILARTGVDPDAKVQEWNDENIAAINKIIGDEIKVEGELRSEVQTSIKRLQDIGCFRGIRHRKGLPVRGQRTRTNSRTRKGKRKTIAGKKKVAKK